MIYLGVLTNIDIYGLGISDRSGSTRNLGSDFGSAMEKCKLNKASLWKMMKNGKKLEKNYDKPCSTYLKPIFWVTENPISDTWTITTTNIMEFLLIWWWYMKERLFLNDVEKLVVFSYTEILREKLHSALKLLLKKCICVFFHSYYSWKKD